jgi:hypothetical protein
VDTWECQKPSNHAIKTNATSTMRRHTDLSKRSHVLLDAGTFRVNTLCADTLLELSRVVNSLTAREHLLPTDKHIKGIRDTNTISYSSASIVNLGVKWPRRLRELINDVKVRLVLGADDFAQGLFLGSAHIFIVSYV